ncbi:ABC transporter ATP-binding protein [Aquimarina muelleri]|uniref:ABC transporter ATP-binding protein n=1 Tax=Aquimarina muelleri TaxID=279356 RepID=A0A918N2R6_9FLAO|nr:ABC transporter ATP-binding protein [Aquimarina muelleri]MCX2762960.1 ABC transporter ATP-binding protein [Aquimarina muelleri]GGX15017.1 ABC transporter ATP-binding protein [Aquimarina muelleri]
MNVIATDINLKLHQGELIGLVGANGIGKSTLLRTLSRVQPALHGKVLLSDQDIQSFKSVELASQLSIVLTEQIASKNLTVQELVALGRQPYTNWVGTMAEADIEKIRKAIEITHITSLVNKRCFELSDGQMQKALIARAIAQDTPFIMLDEPTTHLDIYHKAYILKLLKRLAFETKKTILFSTHEIDFAIQLCDKMIVMNRDGFEFGRPKELIQCRAFSSLFPEDLILFDTQTGSYKVRS